MSLDIQQLDHLVLTVQNMRATCDFYEKVLGFRIHRHSDGRIALHFGNQKINLHPYGNEDEPHAFRCLPGSADLCFLTGKTIPEVLAHLKKMNVPVQGEPVAREGAQGTMTSVYVRDPDQNLVEIAHLNG